MEFVDECNTDDCRVTDFVQCTESRFSSLFLLIRRWYVVSILTPTWDNVRVSVLDSD